jgi:hypothetical protein
MFLMMTERPAEPRHPSSISDQPISVIPGIYDAYIATAKTPIIALVDPALRAQLEQRAKQGDRTLSAEIRRALREHLKRTTDERKT